MSSTVIESLDNEGRGVARVDGKTVFIEGALIGERVEYTSFRKKRNYEIARLERVLKPSGLRVTPRCQYVERCGGCAMQHLDVSAQVAVKQRVLEDALWHIARIRPEQVYAPISGTGWGYRRRARLAVRYVPSKGGVLVGFHERRSSYVVEMDSCEMLPPHVSQLIPELKMLIARMSRPDRLPQIELSMGDTENEEDASNDIQTVLVLRHLESLTPQDRTLLCEFADQHQIVWYLQPERPESASLLHPSSAPPLRYVLPEFDVSLRFSPTDFTQVNHGVNRMLVRRAMHLLSPAKGERIADMFCGLGNFTLPIARLGAEVVGVEGSASLLARAVENAVANGLGERCRFITANLFEATEDSVVRYGRFDKWLVDPPREGAIALVTALSEQHAPRRLVYVSCNPGTLARDAAVLVHQKGYVLRGAGIASMFPHTAHVESIALFERTSPQ